MAPNAQPIARLGSFSSSYAAAATKFIAAARDAGEVELIEDPVRGPSQETLHLGAAWVGRRDAGNVVVVFSWFVYRSRAHGDSVNSKVMSDPWVAAMDPKDSPFDTRRMIYGGFEVIVDV